ncbi:MAG TPA: hypothetical protein VKY89_12535 [Thermoanaerobaculia bacterium]|nr:hypothetical protein [Thermoanaerobaculia bacterium]
MNRTEGRRLLVAIHGQNDDAARELRALIRAWQAPPAAPGSQPPWQAAAAEALAELVGAAAAAALPEGVGTDSRERLAAAVTLGGPDDLAALSVELEARVEALQQPRAELALLQARRRCLELKLRCLDHLDAIFRAERAQP